MCITGMDVVFGIVVLMYHTKGGISIDTLQNVQMSCQMTVSFTSIDISLRISHAPSSIDRIAHSIGVIISLHLSNSRCDWQTPFPVGVGQCTALQLPGWSSYLGWSRDLKRPNVGNNLSSNPVTYLIRLGSPCVDRWHLTLFQDCLGLGYVSWYGLPPKLLHWIAP